jgi:uncharacterized Rmd1/YagE family protein
MIEKYKLNAFLVAYQLDIKGIKAHLDMKPIADSSSELFYEQGKEKYQYYFNYGLVVFSGYTDDEISAMINAISQFQKNPLNIWLRDEFEIEVKPGTDLTCEFDVRGFATQLETRGKLRISRKNMLKFLGKALNTQNDIAENIYIFDAPELVWDDYLLDKLHQGLIRHFDLRIRFSELEYTLRILEDNLKVFRDIYHQRESSILELIIIILILVEVFDLFISKLI